jgi:hypothetical protein
MHGSSRNVIPWDYAWGHCWRDITALPGSNACVGFIYTRVKAKFASTLNGLGPSDYMARTVPTANVSMILTLPAWLTDSRGDSDLRQPAHQG